MEDQAEYINEDFKCIFMPRYESSFKKSDIIKFIGQAQEDAYNQAIQDSVKSLQSHEMIWGNGVRVPSNQFEREILKLKIK